MTEPETPPTTSASSGEGAARLFDEAAQEAAGGTGRAPPPTPAELAPHFPDLEIHEVIGAGGMGVVYRARHRRLERLVALKILPRDLARDPQFAERFAREAKTLARLDHPRIVRVHDFGESGGLYYLVLEYVDGANLRQVMAAAKLTPVEALAIVPQICEALQYAHDQGVVHRDIKPENILLDSRGHVKITDFGLAKLVGKPVDAFTLTNAGQVMGTFQYMAPEQVRTPQEVDHRADLYSLGVVFYEMLTGELPMGRFEPPSQSAVLDARIDRIVMHALERERERRYQRAEEIRTDLTGLSRPAPVPATAPGDAAPGRVDRMTRRTLIFAVLMLPMGAAIYALVHEGWGGVTRGTSDAAAREIWKGVAGAVPWAIGALGALIATVRAARAGSRRVQRVGIAVALTNIAAIVVIGAVAGIEVYRHSQARPGPYRELEEVAEVQAAWKGILERMSGPDGRGWESVAAEYLREDRKALLAVLVEERKAPAGEWFDRSRGLGVYFTSPMVNGPAGYRVVGVSRTITGIDVDIEHPVEARVRFPMVREDGLWKLSIGPVSVLPRRR